MCAYMYKSMPYFNHIDILRTHLTMQIVVHILLNLLLKNWCPHGIEYYSSNSSEISDCVSLFCSMSMSPARLSFFSALTASSSNIFCCGCAWRRSQLKLKWPERRFSCCAVVVHSGTLPADGASGAAKGDEISVPPPSPLAGKFGGRRTCTTNAAKLPHQLPRRAPQAGLLPNRKLVSAAQRFTVMHSPEGDLPAGSPKSVAWCLPPGMHDLTLEVELHRASHSKPLTLVKTRLEVQAKHPNILQLVHVNTNLVQFCSYPHILQCPRQNVACIMIQA